MDKQGANLQQPGICSRFPRCWDRVGKRHHDDGNLRRITLGHGPVKAPTDDDAVNVVHARLSYTGLHGL